MATIKTTKMYRIKLREEEVLNLLREIEMLEPKRNPRNPTALEKFKELLNSARGE